MFNKFLKEAKELEELFNQAGIPSATISSETKPKERDKILEEFKKGKIRVVTNVGVLTTGFDFPELEEIIIARPMLSVALYYQIVGRVLRPHPDGKEKRVVDLAGNIHRFGRIENFEIVEPKPNLHRLKSDVGYLTGVDIKTKRDIELNKVDIRETEKRTMEVIPFGKYKNTHIKKIPNHYIE